LGGALSIPPYHSQVDYRVSFSDVANITFKYTPQTSGDIGNITYTYIADARPLPDGTASAATTVKVFGDDPTSDFVYGQTQGDVFVSTGYFGGINLNINLGDFGFTTFLHETFHAVAGVNDINNVSWFPAIPYNNQKYTIISYATAPDFDESNPPNPYSLQLMDIAALQDLTKGRNYQAHDIDNSGEYAYAAEKGLAPQGANKPFIYTIWDGGGNDTIDASGFNVRAQIDLRQGAFSSIGVKEADTTISVGFDDERTQENPDPGNVAIAFHTVIENAIGTTRPENHGAGRWS
jgi:hypothetical protein